MAPPVTIIGMGVSVDDLTEKQIDIISTADILVGGRRLLASFDHLACRKVVIDKKLSQLGDFLETEMADHDIVVLTSGDPLFFGIGAYLVRRLGANGVRISPNVSAVAKAFSRIKKPWQEVRIVSLHGRNRTGTLLRLLADGETVAVYTDPTHGPAWLAGLLIDNRMEDTQITILENLGARDERITRTTAGQAQTMFFSDLNLVVLEPDAKRQRRPQLFPGMPDEYFAHEKGLITKSEVRAVTLSRLRLFDRAVFWDLGAGSGSVSVEAGQFITRGEIFAVEQHARRIAHIHENCSRFAIGNLSVVEARLPEGLDALPNPDRVFIGGGGENLEQIIRVTTGRLADDGIIVINTVLIDNLTAARNTLEDLGFDVDIIQIQVNRSKPMPYSMRFDAINPVWIITGYR